MMLSIVGFVVQKIKRSARYFDSIFFEELFPAFTDKKGLCGYPQRPFNAVGEGLEPSRGS